MNPVKNFYKGFTDTNTHIQTLNYLFETPHSRLTANAYSQEMIPQTPQGALYNAGKKLSYFVHGKKTLANYLEHNYQQAMSTREQPATPHTSHTLAQDALHAHKYITQKNKGATHQR